MTATVVDISHHNQPIDFGQLKAAGIVAVILKATEGTDYIDPTYADNVTRATEVFGAEFVHAYHFLTNDDAEAQMVHFVSVTQGIRGRWNDYEQNPNGPTCELTTATSAAQILYGKQGKWPGVYGSDKDLLGAALDAGHFDQCARWIADYNGSPGHTYDLWQFSQTGTVDGAPAGEMDLSCSDPSVDTAYLFSKLSQ